MARAEPSSPDLQSARDEPYQCWVVTDGRAGMENQALGLAEAAARFVPLRVTPKRMIVKEPWRSLPRAFWGDPFAHLSSTAALLRPLFPDLWIACGRLSTPFTMAVKRLNAATFTVQTQSPRAPLAAFDLVIPPLHDRLEGANVFSILGAPNRVTYERLTADSKKLASMLDGSAGPRIAVLIGGANRAFSFGDRRVAEFAGRLRALADNGARLMITMSRRTDPTIAESILKALDGAPHFFWDGAAVAGLKNPYFGMLGLADHIVVTEDSINMATEAAATGKPVHVVALDRAPFALNAAKFQRFHAMLRERGVTRPFDGGLETWDYQPLDETKRAGEELARRFVARRTLREVS